LWACQDELKQTNFYSLPNKNQLYHQLWLFNQVFNGNPGFKIGEWRAGGRILNGIKLRFPLNNFSLLWPIDTKLAVWVAYIKRQLGIATQMFVIKVKVTVTKKRNSVSA